MSDAFVSFMTEFLIVAIGTSHYRSTASFLLYTCVISNDLLKVWLRRQFLRLQIWMNQSLKEFIHCEATGDHCCYI